MPVIVLSKDSVRKKQLERKLEEYEQRLKKQEGEFAFSHPDMRLKYTARSRYRMYVLKELLENNKVDTYALSRNIAEKEGGLFDVEAFDEACTIIEDYVKTGGVSLRGGTGLPNV